LIKLKEEKLDYRFIRDISNKINPNDMHYNLGDLGSIFGTFIKIQKWTEIKNKILLNSI
jgi:hypothetical protein